MELIRSLWARSGLTCMGISGLLSHDVSMIITRHGCFSSLSTCGFVSIDATIIFHDCGLELLWFIEWAWLLASQREAGCGFACLLLKSLSILVAVVWCSQYERLWSHYWAIAVCLCLQDSFCPIALWTLKYFNLLDFKRLDGFLGALKSSLRGFILHQVFHTQLQRVQKIRFSS